jgi:hypothetical protein
MTQPTTPEGQALVAAMDEVGSPVGMPYIKKHFVENIEPITGQRQVIHVEEREGVPTAVQRFGLIDSNMVKNFRNRLTAAAVILWNDSLGNHAVAIEQHPWLDKDVPYLVYFGMAMLPISAAVGSSILGGILMAQDFERGMILENRMSPISMGVILGARVVRLAFFGLLGAGCTILALGWLEHSWPESIWRVFITLAPVAVIYGCVGIIAGLHFQKTIPSFLVGLVVSMVGWLLGSAFGLSGGFSVGYESISRLTPNTHAVELMFPLFFGIQIGNPTFSTLILIVMMILVIVFTMWMYHRKVLRQS